MATRYRKRPVVIEAMQWTGDNIGELAAWTAGALQPIDPEDRVDNPEATADLWVEANGKYLPIEPNEWVIRDSRGFYPCKPDVFAETYDIVEGQAE